MPLSPSKGTKRSDLAVLACSRCRKQHLKCDGTRPTCSRCARKGHACHYQPSRRGGRKRVYPSEPKGLGLGVLRFADPASDDTITIAATPRTGMTTPPTDVPLSLHEGVPATGDPPTLATEPSIAQSSFNTNEGLTHIHTDFMAEFPWVEPLTTVSHSMSPLEPTPNSVGSEHDSDRFLRLFYEHFHTAHPILVPSPVYNSREYPSYLRLVVEFTGSHYAHSSQIHQLKVKVKAQLDSECLSDRSSSMVQAQLILSIVLFSRGELDEAHEEFGKCTALAFELGMNRADFTLSKSPIEAESLRRTWWELYITDIMLSIPLRTISFHCSAVSLEVSLPCEEALYTGKKTIPPPHHIRDFKRRALAIEDVVFSSFSYRIEAASILGRVLVLNRLKDHHRDHLQSVEHALVSWSNNLPVDKVDIVDCYGNMDEMMFQAHAFISYASMLLHLPRSRFYPLLSSAQDDFLPFTHLHSSSASTRMIQSIKTTDASKRISDYISLCPNIQKHTPFIIPALVICGLVQLATANSHSEECFEHHYHRVTMVLGCLKNLKRTWFLADHAYDQLRSRAAAMVSESVDKWHAEPMERAIALAQKSLSEAVHSSSNGTSQEGSDIVEAEQSFIEPGALDCSSFSPFADFQNI